MNDEYEFYEHFGNRKPRLHAEYEDAYNSSVASSGVAQPTPKENMTLTKAKTTLMAIACGGMIAVSAIGGIGISNLIEQRQNDIAVAQYFKEEGLNDVLKDAYWSTNNGNGLVHGYNLYTISDHIMSSENPDIVLFGFYNAIDTNKKENMDQIVSMVSIDGVRHENTDEYFAARGFVDKDGNPSFKVYEDVMTERVLAEKTIQDTSSKHGISR